MLVYMLLNTATDMVYIGQTAHSLKKRAMRHKDAKGRKNSRLRAALRDFPWYCWEVIPLQYCASLEQLDDAEARWISECDSVNPNVGYNGQRTAKRSGARAAPKQAELTPEQRERFREWGRKGAQAAKEKMASRAR